MRKNYPNAIKVCLRRRERRWQTATTALCVLLIAAACQAPQATSQSRTPIGTAATIPVWPPLPGACLVVDGDGNMDDLRALAVVTPHWRVAAVIATDGILPAPAGAATFARFLAADARPTSTDVIRGLPSLMANPPAWAWLLDTRRDAGRLEGSLVLAGLPSMRVSTPATAMELGETVARAVQGCSSIGLLVIGPWSSFAAYHGRIAEHLDFVVAQGRSPDDPADPAWDRVNCYFDEASCRAALVRLGTAGVAWVDLPARGPKYPLDDAMIRRLGAAPTAVALRRLMEAEPQWRAQQLWDDAAAVFVVCPGAFRQAGDHFEPALRPVQLRQLVAGLASGVVECSPR